MRTAPYPVYLVISDASVMNGVTAHRTSTVTQRKDVCVTQQVFTVQIKVGLSNTNNEQFKLNFGFALFVCFWGVVF